MAQPQQPHSFHLVLSLVLLLLTVYPYLFNSSSTGIGYKVAAYSADDLYLRHNSIDQFDIIESDEIILSKPISTRSVQDEHRQHSLRQSNIDELTNAIDQPPREAQQLRPEQRTEATRRVQFSSLGRRFHLVLDQPTHLITDDFNIITLDADGKETKVPFNRNNLLVLEGFLDGETNSRAAASFGKQDQLMTAQISTGSETIIVEPTYLHKNQLEQSASILRTMPLTSGAFNESSEDESSTFIKISPSSKIYDKTMIVYRLRDHKLFQPGSVGNHTQFNLDKLCGALRLNESVQLAPNPTSNGNISTQDIEDVFKVYNKKPNNRLLPGRRRDRRGIEFLYEPSRDKTRCTLHLVADYLFYKHVGNGDLQTTINYLLALINRVNLIYLPTVWETGDDKLDAFNNIGFTVQNITIHQEFTRLSSSGDIHYNMNSSRVWGARDFLDNFSHNSPPRYYCLAHLLTYRQFDSPVLGLAYVASTRFGTIGGICSPVQQKGETFYRHNTGISTTRGINGETLITRQADLVLAHELGHNLGAEHDSNECRPSSSNGGAFLMHPYAVLGFERNNKVLSNCSRVAIGRVIKRKAANCFVPARDNECGNGVVEEGEECDGGDVGHGHSDPCCDSSCRFAPGAQCSDRNSWCCSNCRIVPAGRTCRPAEEFNCKQAAYCDGKSAECPSRSPPVEDDRVCVGRGLCRGGECVPFCEARWLHSCLCNTPALACKLCCKTSINSTCVPYDDKAPHLPDGVLCYRGVCEKGRCEQPIQDVIERLWDVIEDINFTTLVKFLRDNIILVVLLASIPLWCVIAHYINEFDRRVKQDVISAIKNRRRKEPPGRSPFLPRLFVGDEMGSAGSLTDPASRMESLQPLKQLYPDPTRFVPPPPSNGNKFFPTPHRASIGFQPPEPGFQLPPGEEVVIEPSGSIAMNSIELPHGQQEDGTGDDGRGDAGEPGNLNANGNNLDSDDIDPRNLYSTQV